MFGCLDTDQILDGQKICILCQGMSKHLKKERAQNLDQMLYSVEGTSALLIPWEAVQLVVIGDLLQ